MTAEDASREHHEGKEMGDAETANSPVRDVGYRLPNAVIYYYVLLRAWRLIAITTAVSVTLGLTYALLATNIYSSSTLLVPAGNPDTSSLSSSLLSRFGGLASLAGVQLGGAEQSDEQEALALLSSRGFISGFISDNKLLRILFSSRWDSASNQWKVKDDIPTLQDGFRLFSKRIMNVKQDPASGVVTLTISWKNPKDAADWANALVRRLNGQLRTRAVNETQRSVKYLRNELEKTSLVGVQQAIDALIEREIGRATVASVRKEYAFTVVDPAVPSDVDKPARPRRVLIVLIALLAGLVIGIAAAYWRYVLGSVRAQVQ